MADVPAVTPPATLELIAAQRGILDAQRLWPDSPAFVLAECLELRGDNLDADRWTAAIRHMIADTEAQRIIVSGTGDDAQQRIADPEEVSVTMVDLSGEPDPHAEAHRLMGADCGSAVDPGAGVTTRHLVLRLSADRLFWYHRAHHIALDGYGFALCARRTAAHYLRLAPDSAADASEPRNAVHTRAIRSLADVVAEDIQYRASEQHQADGDYWRALLAGHTAPTLTDRPRLPAADRLRARRTLTSWKPQTPVRFGAAELILAAVAVYLSRSTGESEVVLGVPMMNRMGSSAATVPAMVLNAIALPVRVAPADTITEIAERIRAGLRSARPHSRYRHEELRRDLGRIGGTRRLLGPIVNIMPFDYDLALPGIEVRADNLAAGPVEDLAAQIYLRSGTAELCLDANPASYTPTELHHHADAITTLIARAAAAPETTVADIATRIDPIQSPNPSPAANPLQRIRSQAASDPHASALLDADTARHLTRAELLTAATGHASRLQAVGVRPGDLVALLPSTRFEDLIMILGIHLAGAAHAALDPTRTPTDLQSTITALAPALLVHDTTATTFAHEITTGTPVHTYRAPRPAIPACAFSPADDEQCPDFVCASTPRPGRVATSVHAEGEPHPVVVCAQPPVSPTAEAVAGRVAYVVFTSGSTGQPKGVVVGREAFAAFVDDAVGRYGWRQGDRVVQFGPLHADTSIEELFVALASGACVIASGAEDRRSVAGLVEAACRTSATVLDLPTAVWHELVIAVEGGAVGLPESLRQVVIGGEQASAEMVSRWQRRSSVSLINSYGPSEAAVVCAAGPVDANHGAGESVSLGGLFPRVGAALRVDELDPACLPDAAGARVGELYLYGPTLAEGYLPDRGDGTGFGSIQLGDSVVRAFRTGDRVRVHADGTLDWLGRIDDLVKIGGQRVHLEAIENALRGIAGIADAVVFRSGPLALAAVVATEMSATPAWLDSVREGLARTLPSDWIPARITAVGTLPRNRNLKLDRAAIAAAAHETATRLSNTAAPVFDPQVDRVLAVFRVVLGDPALAPDADFFASGGTSMQTIAVANRLTLALGTPVSVEDVLTHPTAAELVAHHTERFAAADAPDRQVRRIPTGAPDVATEVAALLTDVPRSTPSASHGERSRILLTGATGFLGAYLLEALLRDTESEILALVRADSDAAAALRLRQACAHTDAEQSVAHALDTGRLTAIRGDCAARELGLPRQLTGIGHIVHSAAVINPLRTYAGLRAANAASTAELLRLAEANGAGLTLISTVTASGRDGALGDPGQIPTGYAQSKCIAEHLVTAAARESRLPATIARLGRVLPAAGDRRTAHRNFLVTVADAARAVGTIPDVTLQEPMVRADTAAATIIATLDDRQPGPRILDLVGMRPLPVRDVLAAGLALPAILLPTWRERVSAAADLDPALKQLVTVWCEIQLAGFDRDWHSAHAIPMPELSPEDVAQLLGIAGHPR
ncbi:AMP-binding protein [Nocardia sp. NPDC051030]|uniref:AMP-binding protein n=1 Tax=Nocardia sp. NPDC051030 TaxID=3155162 RepID=UPI003432CE05